MSLNSKNKEVNVERELFIEGETTLNEEIPYESLTIPNENSFEQDTNIDLKIKKNFDRVSKNLIKSSSDKDQNLISRVYSNKQEVNTIKIPLHPGENKKNKLLLTPSSLSSNKNKAIERNKKKLNIGSGQLPLQYNDILVI